MQYGRHGINRITVTSRHRVYPLSTCILNMKPLRPLFIAEHNMNAFNLGNYIDSLRNCINNEQFTRCVP